MLEQFFDRAIVALRQWWWFSDEHLDQREHRPGRLALSRRGHKDWRDGLAMAELYKVGRELCLKLWKGRKRLWVESADGVTEPWILASPSGQRLKSAVGVSGTRVADDQVSEQRGTPEEPQRNEEPQQHQPGARQVVNP